MKLHEVRTRQFGSRIEPLRTRDEIVEWLKDYYKAAYENGLVKINKDLTINYDGDIAILEEALGRRGTKYFIPVRFNEVTGSFMITSVGGIALDSLHGCPVFVGENLACSGIVLKTLQGAPEVVGKSAMFSGNNIEDLTGCPRHVGRQLDLSRNKLTSLQNIHKIVDHIGDSIILFGNPIKSHILGLLRINKLQHAIVHSNQGRLAETISIINKHLRGDRNIHTCQEELIEAGLKEFARL